ncbi:MAG: serine/threonine-protein kinase [Opitutaceae bacterium]|jgi:serine/threonine protein kinase
MTTPNTPPSGQPDPAALLALGLATQAAEGNATSAPPLTPGELAVDFPQLEIIELIGRGGMGAVYKARQRDLDRLVALKILRPGLDADPGFSERFTREARALAKLNHPGIVILYEFGKTSAGRYFILMEFVDGVNLRQLLSAGRLSPREALAIVPPLCDALQYAHDRGLVHLDIKPENILVDRLGRIKIADFGIAKIATGQAETSASVEIAGTPAYMAPEQRDHPAEVDHRADLYALGVVFYQMLTGELPTADQLRPPSTRVQLDVRLDEIVLRALEKDPAHRYATASEMKTQVETVANTPGTSSSVTITLPPPKRWGLATLLITIILLSCGLYFIMRAPRNTGPDNDKIVARQSLLEQPVKLRAVNWLDQAEAGSGNAWLPTGNDAPLNEWRPPSVRPVLKENAHTRFLCLWFSHPFVDMLSLADVELLAPNDSSSPLAAIYSGRAYSTIPAKTPAVTDGWLVVTTNVDTSRSVPPTVMARLRYSIGPWHTWDIVSSDFNKPRILDYDVTLEPPQEDPKRARAYLEIRSTLRDHGVLEQWDVVALTRDGHRLERYDRHTITQNKDLTERLYFNALLSHVRALEIRKRPIRIASWSVPLQVTDFAPYFSKPAATFDPVVERTWTPSGSRFTGMLDLDTGHEFALAQLYVNQGPSMELVDTGTRQVVGKINLEDNKLGWLAEHKIDLLGTREKMIGVLVGIGMTAVPVSHAAWSDLSVEDIINAPGLTTPAASVPAETTLDGADTWLFLTREGSRGILQIVERTENPRALRFRYKRVRTWSADRLPDAPLSAGSVSTP